MVLGLINEGHSYGYQLDKAIEESQMRYWAKLTKKSLYISLKRLESSGDVESNVEKSEGKVSRRVYHLTPSGKLAFKNMIREGLSSQEYIKFNYSIPITFINELDKEDVLEHVEVRLKWLNDFLIHFPAEDIEDDKKVHFGKRANIKFLRSYYQMEQNWLQWVKSEVEKE